MNLARLSEGQECTVSAQECIDGERFLLHAVQVLIISLATFHPSCDTVHVLHPLKEKASGDVNQTGFISTRTPTLSVTILAANVNI